jgi:predicted RNA binding protein YcfA (HicA-like mRNA interferase family)
MSERLPIVSGKELVRALKQCSWYIHHQTGSYIIMYKEGAPGTIPVPNHKTVAKGTLHQILKDAELSIGAFRSLL